MKVVGVFGILCLFLFSSVNAQLLQQDFEGVASTDELTSNALPENERFTALRTTGQGEVEEWELTNEASNSVLSYVDRERLIGVWTKDHAETSLVRFSFRLNLEHDDIIDSEKIAGTFYFLSDNSVERPDLAVYPNNDFRIADIDFRYANLNEIQVVNRPPSNSEQLIATLSSPANFTLYVNASNQEQTYFTSNGEERILPGKNLDIWANGTLIGSQLPIRNQANEPIRRLKFMGRNNGATGVMWFDNLSYEDLENAGTPLPVQWGRLTAEISRNNCRLAWETLREENNDYFVIERSLNGLAFDSLATQRGAGNSLEIREYAYHDTLPASLPYGQQLYYRLRQVDFDGKQDISSVVGVRYNVLSRNLPYPNPFTNRVRILPALQGNFQVELHDLQGRLVYTAEVFQPLQKQHVDIFIPENLPANHYLLLIRAGQDELIYRIAKK